MTTFAVGDELEPLVTAPISRLQIAYMGVAMRDPNLIHFEEDAARAAGLPGTVAHGTFAQSYLGCAVTRLVGIARLRSLEVQLLAPVMPHDVLTVGGTVTAMSDDEIVCTLQALRGDGTVVARGTAQISADGG